MTIEIINPLKVKTLDLAKSSVKKETVTLKDGKTIEIINPLGNKVYR